MLNPRHFIPGVKFNLSRSAAQIVCLHLFRVGNAPGFELSASSPKVMEPFSNFNKGEKYQFQIKPFSFLLTCHVKELGHPIGTDPEHFRLVAPYVANPGKWLEMDWIDGYGSSGKL
jgi:hypothetical protein